MIKKLLVLVLAFSLIFIGVSYAAYQPLVGTSNQIAITPSVGGNTFSLVGPYTPSTYTANGVLVGNGSSSIAALTVGTNGQVLVGSTSTNPVFATLGAGTGISYTTGAGTLQINNTGVTSAVATANQTAVSSATGAVTFSLVGPYTPSTYTAHGILVGEGTSSIVALAVCANGGIPIGATSADPVCNTITAGTGIAVSNGTNSITLSSSGGGITNTVVASGASPYTVLSTDVFILASAGSGAATVIDLPAASGTNRIIYVKKQDSNAHNISVTPYGTDDIDGSNTVDPIAVQYQVNGYDDYGSGTWAKF